MTIRIHSVIKSDACISYHISYGLNHFQLAFHDEYVSVLSFDLTFHRMPHYSVFNFLLQFIPYDELCSFFDEHSLDYMPSLSNFLMQNYDCTIEDITSAFGVTRQTLYDWFLTSKIKRICAFGAYYRDVLSFDNLGIID